MTSTSRLSGSLTPDQERALARDRHLSVTANAGSGKTRVLVDRYLGLVLSGTATVREIVALTYTEKAAAELRQKIAGAVTTTLAETSDPVLTRRLEVLRNELAAAMIGTIHAFCARILREFPVEADIDAAFGIVEGIDQRALRDDAVRETFRRVLAPDGVHPLRMAVFDAIRILGRSFVVRFVGLMTDRRAELDRLDGAGGVYSRNDDDVIRYWRDRLTAYTNEILVSPALREDLGRILVSARGKDAAAVGDHIGAFAAADNPRSRAASFAALIQSMLTKEGELRVSFVGRGVDRDIIAAETERVRIVAETALPVIPLIIGESTDRDHRVMLTLTRTLLQVTREAIAYYQERKTEAGQLDFEDLQLKLRDVLSLELVCEQLRKRYRYIMVDEYQDTNQLQYDILVPMLAQLARGNLFIVGDPKQSIYSFRQANVGVFEQTRSDIRRAGGEASDIVLEESFRPLRNVAAFVNLVFGQLMRSDAEDYAARILHEEQVRYEPLARARQNLEPGRVEILVREVPPEEDGATEGDLVAARIRELVETGYSVFDKSERPHPVRYRDIAILLRTRSSLPDLEQALIRADIPYAVSSGVGYFQTQDIFDVYSYLQFLQNPADDVALAGVLRSPFFTVSDAELYETAAGRGGRSLWEHLERIAPRPETPDSVRGVVGILRDDLGTALRYPVPELIARIVHRTRYEAKIGGTVRTAQARANLEKLRTIARSFDRQGFASLYDFVQRLRGLIDEEEREGQGAIDTEGDAVQLMTVHGAKGLEFPVVVLPYLHRQTRKDTQFVVDETLGVGFRFDAESGNREWLPLAGFLSRKNNARMNAEEQRIFYVACTRARDLLILSTDTGRRPKGETPREWLLRTVAPNGIGQNKELAFRCSTRVLDLAGGYFIPSAEEHALVVPVLRAVDIALRGISSHAAAPEDKERKVLIGSIPSAAKGEIFSATKIRTYVECPSRYYLRYVLGFPGGAGPYARGDDDDLRDRDIPAELRGRIVHAVLEQLALRRDADPRVEIAAAFEREAPLGLGAGDLFLREVAEIVGTVVASETWSDMSRGTGTRVEYTVSAPLEEDILTGTMDRLFMDASGVWTIVDYKTDAVGPDNLGERAEAYWPQIEFYAFLTAQFFRTTRVRTMLLFTSFPDRPLKKEFADDDLERIGGEIAGVLDRIRAGEFAPGPTVCQGCPFAPEGCKSVFSSGTSR